MTLNKLLIYSTVIITFATVSCVGDNESKKEMVNKYYDLEGILNQQLLFLASANPIIEKAVVVNGQKEIKRLRYDTAGWRKELNFFFHADLNQPNLRDTYVEEIVDTNGLKLIVYSLKNSDEDGIVHLQIKEDATGNISALAADFKEKNMLYTSLRRLRMTFDKQQENIAIKSYDIEGEQKVIFKDTTRYRIHSNVIYK